MNLSKPKRYVKLTGEVKREKGESVCSLYINKVQEVYSQPKLHPGEVIRKIGPFTLIVHKDDLDKPLGESNARAFTPELLEERILQKDYLGEIVIGNITGAGNIADYVQNELYVRTGGKIPIKLCPHDIKEV